jgi:hypothetical protein
VHNHPRQNSNRKDEHPMNDETRAGLLKDEYIMLQHFYEEIDSKGLTIKNWAITVALAAIGAGLVYRKEILLVSFFASLVFWYLEAYWRGLSHFFSTRIQEIERAFQSGTWREEIPLQVYSTWSKEYTQVRDQTVKYLFKQSSILPHTLIAAISLALYFLF